MTEGRKKKRGTEFTPVPWITADGYFDPGKFPMDPVVLQTLSSDDHEFRAGCRMLGGMLNFNRPEAGVHLLGLLTYYAGDLKRLEVLVEQLSQFHHKAAADALLAEFRRVKSSNTTRRYLSCVLRSLSYFPGRLVEAGLEELATDTSFSPKLRAKFRELNDSIVRW